MVEVCPIPETRSPESRSRLLSFSAVRRPSFGVGKGDIGAQADHAEAGGGALTAAEGVAGFKFAFERSGERDDEQVSGGIECYGEDAERGELKEDAAPLGRDELWNEGEEEKRGFGI